MPNTNKKMNVGVVGVGAFVARQHLPNLARDPRYCLHTFCDVNETALAERVEQFNPMHYTTNADKVMQDPAIDLILIGTRSRQHAPLLIQAIKHGKHVYVEKPMTMTREQTREVLAIWQQTRVTVGVGFNRRFAPAMVEAKRLFQSYRKGPSNIICRVVDDHDIRPRYIFDMQDGGGHLLQEGCHMFDLFSWFLGEEPIEVYATGPMETDNIVVLKYTDGSLVTLLCGGKGGLFYPKEALEVFCNRTTLAVDHLYELRLDGPTGNQITRFPLDPNNEGVLNEQTMSGVYEASFAQRPAHDVTDSAEANALYKLKTDHGHTQAFAAFADAVASGGTFSPNVIDGARATLMALSAYDAIAQGRPVAMDPATYLVG